MWDLEYHLQQAAHDKKTGQRIGWRRKRGALCRSVAAVLFVDDCLLFSGSVCAACLEKGVRMLLPADIGVSVEHKSEGPTRLRFLHVDLEVGDAVFEDGSYFRVCPVVHNREFAANKSQVPMYAKLPVYLGGRSQLREDVVPFVFSRLCCFESVFEGLRRPAVAAKAHEAAALLAAEILRLGWPKNWVAFAFKCFPFYKRSLFACVVRMFGRLLQKSSKISVWCEQFRDRVDVVPDLLELLDEAHGIESKRAAYQY
jgi:hypothetical protein